MAPKCDITHGNGLRLRERGGGGGGGESRKEDRRVGKGMALQDGKGEYLDHASVPARGPEGHAVSEDGHGKAQAHQRVLGDRMVGLDVLVDGLRLPRSTSQDGVCDQQTFTSSKHSLHVLLAVVVPGSTGRGGKILQGGEGEGRCCTEGKGGEGRYCREGRGGKMPHGGEGRGGEERRGEERGGTGGGGGGGRGREGTYCTEGREGNGRGGEGREDTAGRGGWQWTPPQDAATGTGTHHGPHHGVHVASEHHQRDTGRVLRAHGRHGPGDAQGAVGLVEHLGVEVEHAGGRRPAAQRVAELDLQVC